MSTPLTWRDIYHEEIDRRVKELRDAKSRSQTWLVEDGRVYNPVQMSESQVQRFAERASEKALNETINIEIEQARLANRPADLN